MRHGLATVFGSLLGQLYCSSNNSSKIAYCLVTEKVKTTSETFHSVRSISAESKEFLGLGWYFSSTALSSGQLVIDVACFGVIDIDPKTKRPFILAAKDLWYFG